MNVHTIKNAELCALFSCDEKNGLSPEQVTKNRERYGKNVLQKRKKEGLFKRVFRSLTEPLMLILLFAFFITLGSDLGALFKTGKADFYEAAGIAFSIALSTVITLWMEGRSQKAFEALASLGLGEKHGTLRAGEKVYLPAEELVPGDVVFLEAGDRVPADGKLLFSRDLTADESSLTGESHLVKKRAEEVLPANIPLAERKNCVFSGTFVAGGAGTMLITATGQHTELGKIAGELSAAKEKTTPIQKKLTDLGKKLSLFGAVSAVVVFLVQALLLALSGGFSFSALSAAFISSVVLLVAAVPEGLPTIVAVSLALSAVKMAKENALVKKMAACETAGQITVICSDKTGTLTENEMRVKKICFGEICGANASLKESAVLYNAALNSTATAGASGGGSATERALLAYAETRGVRVETLRKRFPVRGRTEFSSDRKYMATEVAENGGTVCYFKGAPEVLLARAFLSEKEKRQLTFAMEKEQKKGSRVLCFAHGGSLDTEKEPLVFDGYAVLADPLRKGAKAAVSKAKRAGIRVVMLTGDHKATASTIAGELGLIDSAAEVVSAEDLEKLSDEGLQKAIGNVRVVARSTPALKKRVVDALKHSGEVVAVTGDGVNDAPAIKAADLGFAMGKSGSDVAKESADVVLTDDSFSSVVRAVAYGRTIGKNFRKFILYQVSASLAAVGCILFSLLFGFAAPFNATKLLWINLVMDGPLALSLGLGGVDERLMELPPPRRGEALVSPKMWVRIALFACFSCTLFMLEQFSDFLGAGAAGKDSALFSLFILLNTANALCLKSPGAESAFSSFRVGKATYLGCLMVAAFQVLFVEKAGGAFSTVPLPLVCWLKIFAVAAGFIFMQEAAKLFYRKNKGKVLLLKSSGRSGRGKRLKTGGM